MQKKLLLLSFIEGAAVMVAELCGAKLLAPVFGSSLYVWASVMGITLAALALGYFSGGWISARSKSHALNLFRILNAAALFLILMPFLSYYAVPRISYLPFLPGVVVSALLLLFPPVVCLGAASPLFILVQTRNSEEAGKTSGTVYAVSTVGGIVATFLSGFYLIPQIGLYACLLLFGGLLFLSNVLVLKFTRPLHFFLLALFVYLNVQFMVSRPVSLVASDGMLGRIEVKDLEDIKRRPYRILTVNDIVQTEMDLRSRRSISGYMNIIDTLLPPKTSNANALVLGLGGGLAANLLQDKGYVTEGVELDERIIEAARNYFFLDQQVVAFHEDARYFLNHCTKKYAVVLVDIFKGEEQPSHILTVESLTGLKEHLSDSALVLINWHGYTQGAKGLGTAILLNTLSHSGFYVKLCSYSPDESHRNILFAASPVPLKRLPFELREHMKGTALLNTDNAPLLEKYNAEANKAWRLSYLRYYQGR